MKSTRHHWVNLLRRSDPLEVNDGDVLFLKLKSAALAAVSQFNWLDGDYCLFRSVRLSRNSLCINNLMDICEKIGESKLLFS